MDFKVILLKDTQEQRIQEMLHTIKEKRPSLYHQVMTSLKKNNSAGIREDVLGFLSDHIELLPADDDFSYHIGQFAGNIKLSPEWLEWMLEYYAGEAKIKISDFSMLVNNASLKDISLDDLKSIFARNEDDQLRIMEEIDGNMKTRQQSGEEEESEPDMTEEESSEVHNSKEVPGLVQDSGSVPGVSNREGEAEKPGFVGLFDDILTAVSMNRKPDESVNEVRDRFTLMYNNLQKLLTEFSAATTESFRAWEKDREEIERLRSLYSMLQRVLEQQTQVINELRSENYRLKEQLDSAQKTAIQREAINQRIQELGNLVRDAEKAFSIDMIPEQIS